MENVSTIVKDFGYVPCGVKVVETFKFENNTKKTQLLQVCQECIKSETPDAFLKDKFHIRPTQVELHPKQIVCFKLTYYSHVEDVVDNYSYKIFDSETLLARLIVHAKSVGPSLHPTTLNVKFFRFRDVNQTVKHIEINNTAKQEAKFFFDMDEDYRYFEISQTRGVIPADLKFGLKLTFKPIEPGVFYKKIYCIIEFHKPIIFYLIAVYKPKIKLDPKNITLKYPRVRQPSNNYEAYMHEEEFDKLPEGDKTQPLQKCLDSLDLGDIVNTTESDHEKTTWQLFPEPDAEPKCRKIPGEIFLTRSYVDVKNVYEFPLGTSILNFSNCQHYYYEWDHDPNDHFQVSPCKGLIKPNTKADFTIYFTPSSADRLYHVELDVKIFLCNVEPEEDTTNTIELPLMKTLRIIGHSFAENSCGWVSQCKISPKILHLRACVINEKIYGTFVMEREGHLPVTYSVVPTKDRCFSVYPPLGYLSKNFQLFVVQFDSSCREPGVYREDLKIKFNNSDMNVETIKVVTSIETPQLIFGEDNKVEFTPIFPGSSVSTVIKIINPTHLQLTYEFLIPESVTWLELVEITGTINPRSSEDLTVIFKPIVPCEYLAYIPCQVSPFYKPDNVEEMQLEVRGSCQFGYLVAIPSIHDFGNSVYKKEKTIEIHLFNFSFILLYFQLTAINNSFPPGDADTDVTITPKRGKVPAKGSVKVEVTLTPHNIGYYEYTILCQNLESESLKAESCEAPRKIILLKMNGVLPCIQIIDLHINDGGPLFSSQMLWKMMCIDQLNAALRSQEPLNVIKANIPEAVRGSQPISLAFLIETWYNSLTWNVNMETQCPCFEASAGHLGEECYHTKTVSLRPTKYVTQVSERTVLVLKIHYDSFSDTVIVMTINLPYKKQVKLKMPLICLPEEPPTCLSTYFNPVFHLRPVFIGDRQPPLQLFWLYNNTSSSASYSLDMEVLHNKEIEQKIFQCINPEGEIQPYSSYPLGIIFSPNEMTTYTLDLLLDLGKQPPLHLRLIGEGVLKVEPIHSISIEKESSPSPVIMKGDVECCTNYINIPFVGVHSQISRIFVLENTSTTEKWSFEWSSYSAKDIFSAAVEPKKGIIEPTQKLPMTLSVTTYGYPVTMFFSMACEVLNNTQLSAYKECIKIHEMVAQRDKEYFTITENGVTYEETDLPIVDRPIPQNIFITVNVNVLSDLHMEELLSKNTSHAPKAVREIYRNSNSNDPTLKSSTLEFTQIFLEKLLWDILFHQSFVQKIQLSQTSQEFVYMQLLPKSQKKKEELLGLLKASPSKRFVQDVLESVVQELMCKSFIPERTKHGKFE